MLLLDLIIFSVTVVVSYAGVRAFIGHSRTNSILDIPNERSSHAAPTPRGGGMVIVLASLAFYFSLTFWSDATFSKAYLLSATAVSTISLIDDLRSVPFFWRLLVHVAAAAFFVAEVFQTGRLAAPDSILTNILIFGLCVVWIVWFTNAFNFMDGIDGIAGLQAVIAGLGWFALATIEGSGAFALYPLVISASALGFLIPNWPPARVFMGDVGSTFLGYTLAALPILEFAQGKKEFPILLLTGIILVWFFVFDTVLTMLGRLLRRQKIWTAHREHIYQKLVIAGMSHRGVTLLYGSFAAILAIEAVMTAIDPSFGLYTLVSVPLLTVILLGIRFKKALT